MKNLFLAGIEPPECCADTEQLSYQVDRHWGQLFNKNLLLTKSYKTRNKLMTNDTNKTYEVSCKKKTKLQRSVATVCRQNFYWATDASVTVKRKLNVRFIASVTLTYAAVATVLKQYLPICTMSPTTVFCVYSKVSIITDLGAAGGGWLAYDVLICSVILTNTKNKLRACPSPLKKKVNISIRCVFFANQPREEYKNTWLFVAQPAYCLIAVSTHVQNSWQQVHCPKCTNSGDNEVIISREKRWRLCWLILSLAY